MADVQKAEVALVAAIETLANQVAAGDMATSYAEQAGKAAQCFGEALRAVHDVRDRRTTPRIG